MIKKLLILGLLLQTRLYCIQSVISGLGPNKIELKETGAAFLLGSLVDGYTVYYDGNKFGSIKAETFKWKTTYKLTDTAGVVLAKIVNTEKVLSGTREFDVTVSDAGGELIGTIEGYLVNSSIFGAYEAAYRIRNKSKKLVGIVREKYKPGKGNRLYVIGQERKVQSIISKPSSFLSKDHWTIRQNDNNIADPVLYLGLLAVHSHMDKSGALSASSSPNQVKLKNKIKIFEQLYSESN